MPYLRALWRNLKGHHSNRQRLQKQDERGHRNDWTAKVAGLIDSRCAQKAPSEYKSLAPKQQSSLDLPSSR